MVGYRGAGGVNILQNTIAFIPAVSSRGLGYDNMVTVGGWVLDLWDG